MPRGSGVATANSASSAASSSRTEMRSAVTARSAVAHVRSSRRVDGHLFEHGRRRVEGALRRGLRRQHRPAGVVEPPVPCRVGRSGDLRTPAQYADAECHRLAGAERHPRGTPPHELLETFHADRQHRVVPVGSPRDVDRCEHMAVGCGIPSSPTARRARPRRPGRRPRPPTSAKARPARARRPAPVRRGSVDTYRPAGPRRRSWRQSAGRGRAAPARSVGFCGWTAPGFGCGGAEDAPAKR